MKLRLTGTRAECEQFTTALLGALSPGVVRQVSRFHPNHRGPAVLGRVYLDLDLPAPGAQPDTTGATSRPSPMIGRTP
jgi:hypothetical protein